MICCASTPPPLGRQCKITIVISIGSRKISWRRFRRYSCPARPDPVFLETMFLGAAARLLYVSWRLRWLSDSPRRRKHEFNIQRALRIVRVCAIGCPIADGARRALNRPIDHGFGCEQDISYGKRIDQRDRSSGIHIMR